MLLKNIVSVGEDISYRDVLSDDFFSNYPYTRDNGEFLSSLKKYHKIDKLDASSLFERIVALSEMRKTLLCDDLYSKNIALNIDRKLNQLKFLKKMFDEGVLRDKKELYNPEIEALFKSKDMLDLKNDLIFDFGNNVLLGKYVLEAIDPAHRFTTVRYIEPWQNQSQKVPFFLYLEEHCKYDLIPQIEYFSDEKLAESKITIKNGKLYTANGELLTTDSREFLFVLGKDNNFYGCYSQKGVKHTSLSLGDSIKCGGAITAKEGNITSINLDSGHYFPSLVHLNKFVYYLKQANVNLPDETPVNYHENYVRKCITLKKGLER